MPNPWDKDPIVSTKAAAQPWDNDPIVSAAPAAAKTSLLSDIGQGIGNLAAGAVRGAGSIGATLLAPIDMAKDAMDGKGLSLESNRQRRADMDSGLQYMGADPNSALYKGGKLAGEIAGTAGAGGVVGNGLRLAAPGLARVGMAGPTLQSLATSIGSGGFTTGAAAGSGIRAAAGDLGLRAAGGAISGAASAGLVDPSDAGAGAVIGGVLPGAMKLGAAAIQRIGRAITGGPLSPEVRALATRAQELGIDIPADRLTDSKALNAVASSLNYVPFSGRAATEQTMQNQLNRALSATFGQNSANVTAALRKAQGDLGAEFDRVLQSNTVRVDQPFLDALTQAESRATSELGSDGARVIKNQIDEIMDKVGASGEIDGQAAYNIKRTLDRIGLRNTPEAYYASDLKRDLMGALDRSMGPAESAAFKTTRQQYGNMLALEKLAKNGAEGDVSIARIANMKNIGNADLQELADISAQFLKPREGMHGAAQRTVAGGAAALLGGVPGLVAGAATGRVANAALNSQTLRGLMMNQGQAAGSPALQQLMYQSAPVLGSR